MRVIPALVALLVALIPVWGWAADFSLKKSDSGLEFILIEGEITDGDEDHFKRLAVGADEALVILHSPGGALLPALEIGKTIQLKGFSTYVPAGTTCVSSCALIWIAGAPRYKATEGRIGFHASYRDNNGRQEEIGVGNAVVGRYLTLLNLSERAIIFATSASPDTVLWLTEQNSRQAGITFEVFDISDEQSSSETTGDLASAQERGFEWQNGPWLVSSHDWGCNALAVFTSEGGVDNRSMLGVGLGWSSDNAVIFFSNDKFRSLRSDQKFSLEIILAKGEKLDSGWGKKEFESFDDPGLGKGLMTGLVWKDLRSDLVKNDTIGFFNGDNHVDQFPLEGSAQAIKQLEACLTLGGAIAAAEEAASGAADAAGEAPSVSLEDPFARDTSQTSDGDWVSVARSDDGNATTFSYVNRNSIKRTGAVVQYWERMDLTNNSDGWKQSMVLYEGNCSTGQRRILHLTIYNRDGTNTSDSEPDEWEYLTPDSVGEGAQEFVCGKGAPIAVGQAKMLIREAMADDDFEITWMNAVPQGEPGNFRVFADRVKKDDPKSDETKLCDVSITSNSPSWSCETATPSMMRQSANMLIDDYESRKIKVHNWHLERTGKGNEFEGYFELIDPRDGKIVQVPCSGDQVEEDFDINCELP